MLLRVNKHEKYLSSLYPPVYQRTIKLQKTCFPDAGCNKTGITVVVYSYNCCIPVNSGKLSLLNWTGLQQEHEFNSGNNENQFKKRKKAEMAEVQELLP